MTIPRWVCAVFSCFFAVMLPADRVAASQPERVQFASGDAPAGAPVVLSGWWFKAPLKADAPAAPAVLMLHGCGGMLNRRGEPTVRIREYAALLNQQGWHALAVDSLSPRGETELCTQRIGTRKITQVQRRLDALASLQWLASQPGADAGRLALLGWSHGGSAVLSASNLDHPDVAKATVQPRLAVAFYPGCETEVRRGYRPAADALLLVGLADDWTPAAPCQALAGTRGGHTIQVEAYEGAYHGFDGLAPLTHRKEVPNGVHPGQGVHVGGQPAAREQSRQALLRGLQAAFAR
jgi:dienelactone hydrolase